MEQQSDIICQERGLRNSQATRRSALSPTRLQLKRASDRMSQQLTRAKTKAYIAHLERTTARLTEMHSDHGSSVAQQLKEQFDEISELRDTIARIAKLATGIGSSVNKTQSAKDPARAKETPSSGQSGSANTFNPASHPNQESLQELYPMLDVACGDRERDYFQVLDVAFQIIERNHARHVFSSADVDDDINIRAVLHGWDAARAKNPLDVGWQLLQGLDEGFFFRSGQVERIAILRVIRSELMAKINPELPPERRPPAYMNPSALQSQVEHSRLVDFFVWPDVRDYLIVSGISYAPESLAAQFAADIGLKWSYDVRDTCNYQLSKGMYTFSKIFNDVYENLDSWYMKSPAVSIYLPPLSPQQSAEESKDDWAGNLVEEVLHSNTPHERLPQTQAWDGYWGGIWFGEDLLLQ
ncbi:hypothetical protein LTR84_004088 [Exophiala bonariae]|uniref:Uncharacterized protein n=1 Tax=Exophiala bonariae TaxID=1690606 RepID=A0AAV9N7H8_9EURO|nr:hypothetical protein LTR84_004088 [Exophiala bonariae]